MLCIFLLLANDILNFTLYPPLGSNITLLCFLVKIMFYLVPLWEICIYHADDRIAVIIVTYDIFCAVYVMCDILIFTSLFFVEKIDNMKIII